MPILDSDITWWNYDRSHFMTRERLSMQMKLDYAIDSSR